MNLANELLRKHKGNTVKIANTSTLDVIHTKKQMKRNSTKYFDEEGNPELAINIVNKYRVNAKKVRDAFTGRTISEAYEFIKTDQRVNNGQSGVYFDNNGNSVTAKELGKMYGVSKSKVQREYVNANKDPVIANAEIEKYVNSKLNDI